MRPDLIASGIGLASRQELCGLIALLNAAGVVEVARGAGENLASRLGAEINGVEVRMVEMAGTLDRSTVSNEVLRHKLWHGLVRALDTRCILPLSEKRMAEEASALGVMASRVLSPGLLTEEQRREREELGRAGIADRMKDRIRDVWNEPSRIWRDTPPLPFPEIIARELASLLDGLDMDGSDPATDPHIADALKRGGEKAWTAIAAGGGWVAIAAAVNAAGFAPYILAAQVSAFVPFVGGPAAVSFLAVMVNPVTIATGLLALGGLGGRKISQMVQRQVAARIAVLLALRGLADPRKGLGHTATCFRRICRSGAARPDHLSTTDWRALLTRVARIEALIGMDLPDAPGAPPMPWGAVPAITATSAPLVQALATAGLTIADMLFHAAVIDPRVLAAADFWRSAEISDPMDFALYATDFAVRGADVALRGFTAEQVVMGQLISQGHHVSLPDSSSNPGFDLIVDGNEVQVKCAEGLSALEDHFAVYPGIPVIANAELVEKITDQPWANLVTTIDGYELETVEAITERSVEAGIELGAPNVLFAAIGVGALRGAMGVMNGEIPAGHLPEWLVVDTALRGGLVIAGGKAGAALGLIAVGPAGALILGPALGAASVFGVDGARMIVDRTINPDWYNAMRETGEALRNALLHDLDDKIGLLVRRRAELRQAAADVPENLKVWIDRRAADDAIAAAEVLQDVGEPPKTPFDAMRLDVTAARAAPADPAVLQARQMLREHLSSKPGPLDGVFQKIGRLGGQIARTR
jgi:hypothetical protein